MTSHLASKIDSQLPLYSPILEYSWVYTPLFEFITQKIDLTIVHDCFLMLFLRSGEKKDHKDYLDNVRERQGQTYMAMLLKE